MKTYALPQFSRNYGSRGGAYEKPTTVVDNSASAWAQGHSSLLGAVSLEQCKGKRLAGWLPACLPACLTGCLLAWLAGCLPACLLSSFADILSTSARGCGARAFRPRCGELLWISKGFFAVVLCGAGVST